MSDLIDKKFVIDECGLQDAPLSWLVAGTMDGMAKLLSGESATITDLKMVKTYAFNQYFRAKEVFKRKAAERTQKDLMALAADNEHLRLQIAAVKGRATLLQAKLDQVAADPVSGDGVAPGSASPTTSSAKENPPSSGSPSLPVRRTASTSSPVKSRSLLRRDVPTSSGTLTSPAPNTVRALLQSSQVAILRRARALKARTYAMSPKTRAVMSEEDPGTTPPARPSPTTPPCVKTKRRLLYGSRSSPVQTRSTQSKKVKSSSPSTSARRTPMIVSSPTCTLTMEYDDDQLLCSSGDEQE